MDQFTPVFSAPLALWHAPFAWDRGLALMGATAIIATVTRATMMSFTMAKIAHRLDHC